MNWDWEKLQEKRQRKPGGSSGGGGSGGPTPPDFEQLKEKLMRFKNMKFPGLKIAIGVIVLLWLASGFYIVQPDEVGVVQRFGAFVRVTQPGPHLRIPFPIESVQTPSVTKINRMEVGFRSAESMGYSQGNFRKVPKEALMLTGDENIVDVQFIVQYRIKAAENYLFNIAEPVKTVKDAAEASMRAVIGSNDVESVLTERKMEIQQETMELLQSTLDKYESGISITAVKLQDVHPPDPVVPAFKDVASAREDRSRLMNQAKSYRNEILPKARGKVATVVNEAEAFKESKVRKAKGESERFLKLLAEYRQAEEVTRKRLYLEAMEDVFVNSRQKTILSDKAAEKMLPYLPLDQLQKRDEQNK